MQRTSFGAMSCPIARSLERVGEWWSILILRDAFAGITRFEAFQKSLGIAPGMLTRRLEALVESGMLARHRYCEKPPRHEYRLTARGADFRPVLIALLAWGNRHFAPEGASIQVVDAATGQQAEPILVDRASLRPILSDAFRLAPGPAASPATRARLAASGGGLAPSAASGGGLAPSAASGGLAPSAASGGGLAPPAAGGATP